MCESCKGIKAALKQLQACYPAHDLNPNRLIIRIHLVQHNPFPYLFKTAGDSSVDDTTNDYYDGHDNEQVVVPRQVWRA